MSDTINLSSRWTPLPDPHRPDFPYHRSSHFTIRRHTPPPPFGSTGYSKGQERQEAPREHQQKMSHSAWCLGHPPADTSPHADQTQHRLNIIDQIACKDGRGSQVVKCYLDRDQTGVYTAKIYDAMYYAYADREFGTPVDVTWQADQDYTREAAAYEDLAKAGVNGVFTPKYYGSWTFDVAMWNSDVTHPVRMILMEWLSGTTVGDLIKHNRVARLSPEERLDILARAMEIECKLMFHRVLHRDFAPRNIFIETRAQDPNQNQGQCRVVLLDFHISACLDRPNCRRKHTRLDRPINPIYRYWGRCPNEFLSWVPEPHRSQPNAFKGWMKARWDGSQEFADRSGMEMWPSDYDEPFDLVPPQPDCVDAPKAN